MNNELMAWVDEQIEYYKDWNKSLYDFEKKEPYKSKPQLMFEEIKKELTAKHLMENEPILTIDEIIYLKNTLRPFKDKIDFIYLELERNDNTGAHLHICSYSNIIDFIFPTFALGTMYKGMEINREYSLNELGINYD